MATVIRIPAVDESTEQVRIVGWLKQLGEPVAAGEALMEVETDKAVVEVESFAEGILLKTLAAVDDTVPVGGAVAVIGAEGEDPEAALEEASAPAPAPEPAAEKAPAAPAEPDVTRIEITPMRAAIAKRMSESLSTIPHFFSFDTVQVPALSALHKGAAADAPGLNDAVIYAAAVALKKVPQLNSSWAGDHIKQFTCVNVGFVVAVDGGLVIPVLRDADKMSLAEIAAASKALVAKARGGKLHPDDMRGGTFTISNLAPAGPRMFTSIINPPQAAILAVGGVRMAAVASLSGEVTARAVFDIGLTCDHRVVDGVPAAAFLAAFKQACKSLAAE